MQHLAVNVTQLFSAQGSHVSVPTAAKLNKGAFYLQAIQVNRYKGIEFSGAPVGKLTPRGKLFFF